MKILLTGATGFVGRRLVHEISRSAEHKLLLVVRDVEKATELFPDIQYDYALLEDIEAIRCFNPDLVFHLAAKVTSANNVEVVEELVLSNVLSGVKLLSTLNDCNHLKLFVNIGTFAEYRSGSSHIDNAYLYSATKTAFRAFLDYYSDLRGYKYLHVVPYTIYGERCSSRKIIDYIVDSLDAEVPVKMSEGKQVLDFIHVDDVVRFLIFIINEMQVFLSFENAETIHLGTGVGTSIRELVKLIENKSGKKTNIEWGALPYRDKDVMYAVAPIEKLKELEWNHIIEIEDLKIV